MSRLAYGKGSDWRPTDWKSYRSGMDRIFRKKKKSRPKVDEKQRKLNNA